MIEWRLNPSRYSPGPTHFPLRQALKFHLPPGSTIREWAEWIGATPRQRVRTLTPAAVGGAGYGPAEFVIQLEKGRAPELSSEQAAQIAAVYLGPGLSSDDVLAMAEAYDRHIAMTAHNRGDDAAEAEHTDAWWAFCRFWDDHLGTLRYEADLRTVQALPFWDRSG